MPSSKTKSLALIAGLAAVFLTLEGGLRLFGAVWNYEAGSRVVGTGDKILIVGNSHTRGMLPRPGYSYPDQLGALLAARYPGRAPAVVNGGEMNQNSAELLEKLPSLLDQYHPRALVVMSGESNFWNRHLLNQFLDRGPGPLDFLARWKTVRLFSLLWNTRRDGYKWSRFFRDVPVEEFPTIAMRWVGYLNANPDLDRLSATEREEAHHTLEQWLNDPRSGAPATATRVLADLDLRINAPDAAAHAIDRYFQRGGGFNLPLSDWIAKHLPNEKRMAKLAPSAKVLASIRPISGGAAGGASEADLHSAISADSGNPAIFGFFAGKLNYENRRDEARRIFLAGLRENPFYSGGEPPPYQFHRYFSETEFRSLLAEAMPPPAGGSGEKPALVSLRESFLDQERILAWAYRDLAEIVRLARDRHVPVLLQTYPPERFSGKDRAVDGVIREVALALDVPLSDTSSELNRQWGKSDHSRFYGTPGMPFDDDHLNEAGNGLVAEILAEDLRRLLPQLR